MRQLTRLARSNAAFYTAARRFVEDCLRSEGSLLSTEHGVWTAACIGELYERVVERPEEPRGTDFFARLSLPLQDASHDVVQLAAEVLYVLLLPQETKLATKREHVVAVLSLAEESASLPDELSEALACGIASYGPAISQRFAQYVFLLEFAHGWIRRERRERQTMLLDPDRFREFVFSLPRKAASAQVEALLHMVFPDHFEPIVSVEIKRKIVEAFPEHSPDSSLSVDRRIALIRGELTGQFAPGFSFLDPEIRALWDRELAGAPSGEPRAWLVRAGKSNGMKVFSQWLEEEFVSLLWPGEEQFDLAASEAELRNLLSSAKPQLPPGQVRRIASVTARFLAIKAGDLIVTPDGDEVYVACASGDARWSEGERIRSLRRPVEWLNRKSPIRRLRLKDSTPTLYTRLQTLQSVCDLQEQARAIRQLVGLDEGDSAHSKASQDAQSDVLPPITESLAKRLYLPSQWLQTALELLHEKRQLIFYGPPGTGKTYVAQALGEHVREAGGDWQLVQFHPAYSYEDFFEGYRPASAKDGGALQFALRGGPLRLLAEQAAQNPRRPYLLVIDEINRGNIAKIFGELYFLLEYRDQPIRLQYSPERPFELPKNLYLIGTMNTADRSIALVDSALRRRFYFYPFLPREAPVREVLGLWLLEHGYDIEPALLLGQLNDALAEVLPEEDFAIGPSYLMPREGEPDLERAWRHAIRPLLEERFYGSRPPDELEREFGLAAMRARLQGEPSAALGGAMAERDGLLS
ncbi:MAG TPA: AAA family ATPase [Solirubrobacteraceae bacterium]